MSIAALKNKSLAMTDLDTVGDCDMTLVSPAVFAVASSESMS